MENENIFADVPREGHGTLEESLNSVDKELQEEKPAESQSEKDEALPDLKQNETWKRLREERDTERQAREDLEARLSKIESERVRNETVEESPFITSLVGENEEVTKQFRGELSTLKEQIKQELIQEQVNASKKEAEQKAHWNKWTEERLAEVESEFKVNFKSNENMKNELSNIMLEYSPTDNNGNLDYRKGMKILNSLKAVEIKEENQKTNVKKNIADATVSKETSVKSNKDFLTHHDLKGGWRSVVNR